MKMAILSLDWGMPEIKYSGQKTKSITVFLKRFFCLLSQHRKTTTLLDMIKQAISGAQILFVAFGAMVLASLLTGLSPSIALLEAGISTLLFFNCAYVFMYPFFWALHLSAPIIYVTQM